MPKKQRFYYVYILSSLTGTLYTGITNSIYNRTLQHKGKETPDSPASTKSTGWSITKFSPTCGRQFVGKKKSKVGLAKRSLL